MSQNIPNIKLNDSSEIPAFGLGTWRLFEEACTVIVEKALKLGYRHLDTAEMYNNEEYIGKAISGIERTELYITSKVWIDNLHYNDVITACKRSLNKLGTDYLDFYLIHWPKSSIPMEETLNAMTELHSMGLIRSIGVSNFTIPHLEKALRISTMPIVTNQVEFHPYLYQKELLAFCKENNIVLTAWAPLARGKVFDDPVIKSIAENRKKTPAQITLRWLLHKGLIIIPKASSEKHLRENIALFDWMLNDDEITAIDNIPTEQRLIDLSFSQ
ncbi:aldo/keto reductase [bacterium]|nr:aldo/keto reductase [bacterium]